MKTKLLVSLVGMCLGLGVTLLMAATLFVTPVFAQGPAGQVDICHLQDKVDASLLFNDGIVITVNANACAAHCRHGDQPMPIPLNNNAHPNRLCARIHVSFGLPECEVNTPDTFACTEDACIARCLASQGPRLNP